MLQNVQEDNMIRKFGDYIKESSNLELHYYAFDWDDNILHMSTVIHMDQKVGDGWLPIDVSTAEFATLRNDKQGYRLRNNDPGEAFCEFRDFGPRGGKAFLEDTMDAVNQGRFAPAWEAFIKCLSEGSIFAIVTARGHEPETIKSAVEYIINNILTDDQKFSLYSHCLKNAYLFSPGDVGQFSRIPKDKLTESPLIQVYLDNCDFYGVSSESFRNEFGQGSTENPEVAKEMALDKFIEKCNHFGEKIGAKSVSIGFSDDDPKNVDHVKKFFKEKSALTNNFEHETKFNIYKTTDRNKPGGERSRFSTNESSHQVWGMEGSVMPFTKWNNDTQWHYPNTKDAPKDDYHNQMKNKTNQSKDLYKEFAYKRKK